MMSNELEIDARVTGTELAAMCAGVARAYRRQSEAVADIRAGQEAGVERDGVGRKKGRLDIPHTRRVQMSGSTAGER